MYVQSVCVCTYIHIHTYVCMWRVLFCSSSRKRGSSIMCRSSHTMGGLTGAGGEGTELSLMVGSHLSSVWETSDFYTALSAAFPPWLSRLHCKSTWDWTEVSACAATMRLTQTAVWSRCVCWRPFNCRPVWMTRHRQQYWSRPGYTLGCTLSAALVGHVVRIVYTLLSVMQKSLTVFPLPHLIIYILSNCRGQHNCSKPVLPNAWPMSLRPQVQLMRCSLLLWWGLSPVEMCFSSKTLHRRFVYSLTTTSCHLKQDCSTEELKLFGAHCLPGPFGGQVSPPPDYQCSAQSTRNSPDWFPFLCVTSPPENNPHLGLFYKGNTM